MSTGSPVVLTREREDNEPLARRLAGRGVPVLEIPCAQTVYLHAALPSGPVEAVAFSSRRGVRGLEMAGGLERLKTKAPAPIIAAVGEATAAELERRGVGVDITARPPTGERLAEMLACELRPGARVALVCAAQTTGIFQDKLASRGIEVVEVPAYENPAPPIPRLAPRSLAAIFFAAPSAAGRLFATNPWMRRCRACAIGPTTYDALIDLGASKPRIIGTKIDDQLAALCELHDNDEGEDGIMSNRYERSKELFEKARAAMPGGVSSPVRAFKSVGGTPIYFERAKGARFWDADGNEFTDYCMSWGPLILGHAHPEVVEAVCRTARDGLSFGACCRQEIELAEAIAEPLKSADRVRFVSSGTEGVMSALRLARGATGREKVVKFEGGYHGHTDSLLVKAGSGLATFGTSSSRGVTGSTAADTVVCPLDDEQALDKAFADHGDDIAAVIVEPIPANNGLLTPRPEWLRHLRSLTEKHGTLLIADEVITGFRLGLGSHMESQGIRPDLLTFGKIIGGGMPVGAVAGPARLMEKLAPEGDVYQAGTLSGNPVSLAAGRATLDVLKKTEPYEKLDELGRHLEIALSPHAEAKKFRVARQGSVFWLHLVDDELPRKVAGIDPRSTERYGKMHGKLLDRGIYFAPSAFEVGFLSTAHTREDVDALAEAIGAALD